MSEYAVPIEDAMKCLDVIPDYDQGNGPEPCVHTIVQAGPALVGAHWPVDHVRAAMEKHGVEVSGDAATSTGHGLVVLRPAPHGPLFLATGKKPS